MKLKKYFLLAFIIFSLNAYALEKDKVSHLTGSAAASFISYSLLQDTQHPVAYSVGIVMAFNVINELHDRNQANNHFSSSDLAAGLVGALAGAYIGKGFYYVNKKVMYKTEF